jgi:uncharacterized short protein YbdD (DUF466 family)
VKNRFACAAVSWLRGVTGDDAYDKYLEHHARNHPDTSPMTREVFFAFLLEQKWSGINRCC